MSRFLDPYIALDQFNTGYAQQQQTMEARQQAEAQRQRMAMAQQEQAFQESRFGYQQGQDAIDNQFRQGEADRHASEFGLRQGLDERQFGLATDQFAAQQAQEAEELKQRQIKAAAVREYVRRRSSKLRGAGGTSGAGRAQALPPGGGVMSMQGGMPQAAGAAPMDMDFGMGQDERPTMAPQQGQAGFVGMQGPAIADPSEEQQFANSIADLMDTLDVEGLPQAEVMRQVDEYSNLVMDAQKKRRAMEFWKNKGPRWAHKVEEIQADLSAAEMQLLEKDAARTWSSNSANPEFQRRVADQMRLNPKAPRANVEAWVREDINNGVNQNRTNLSGEERQGSINSDPEYMLADSRYDAALKKYEAAMKGLPGPEIIKPLEAALNQAQAAREAVLMKRMGGAAMPAGQAQEDPNSIPIVIEGKSGTAAQAGGFDKVRLAWDAAIQEFTKRNRRAPTEADAPALKDLSSEILKQAALSESKRR